MEKRRVRLMVNGMPVSLLTDESDEYMQELVRQVEADIHGAETPYGPTERPLLMAALNLCDRAIRAEKEGDELKKQLEEKEARLNQQEDQIRALRASLERLEGAACAGADGLDAGAVFAEHRNPFRAQEETEPGLKSFFEIDADGGKHNA